MIGLVPRYVCERCAVVVDGPVSWKHGITPATVAPAAMPPGSTHRWDGHERGDRWWCADCTIALAGPGYEAAKTACAAARKARYAIAYVAQMAALDAQGPEPEYPADPFEVPHG